MWWPWNVMFAYLKRIEAKIDQLLARGRPVSGWVILCGLEPTNLGECGMVNKLKGKVGMVAVPNFTMAELASKGALLQLFDAGDNPAPLPTTPYTTTWSTGDTTVLTVAPSATDPSQATVTSTGKVGSKVPVTCLVHATDTPPSFADIDASCTVDVPAGPPTQGTIALAP